MNLMCIHQTDPIHFNFSVIIYIRIAFQHIIDNLEDYGFKFNYSQDKTMVVTEIDKLLCNPEIRVNERPFLEFENYKLSCDDLFYNEVKVGKILE